MGAEFDRLSAAFVDLETKVANVEAFIETIGTPAATPAQLTAFAEQLEAANLRLASLVVPV